MERSESRSGRARTGGNVLTVIIALRLRYICNPVSSLTRTCNEGNCAYQASTSPEGPLRIYCHKWKSGIGKSARPLPIFGRAESISERIITRLGPIL